jgi:aldose 1-epimerase
MSLQVLRIGSKDGLQADILPFGARLAALWVPARTGLVNVVLGYPDPRAFADDPFFLGATVGRTSGRIAGARFSLEGREYRLPANEGRHHLHGGPLGFHALPWRVEAHETGARPQVVLELTSRDGDEGYPGNLAVTVTFRLEPASLVMDFMAIGDAPTPVSLTNHAYYNLSGKHSDAIDTHVLTLNAEHILELDAEHIPTGKLLPVAGGPFDFRSPTTIGARAQAEDDQLRMAGGYDHTFVASPEHPWVARLQEESSGLELRLSADQPGLQFYAGGYLHPRAGAPWGRGCGLCLEPQQFPNAVNESAFPSPVLQAGRMRRNTIRLTFAASG